MGEMQLQLTGEEQKIRAAPPLFGIQPCNNIFSSKVFFKKWFQATMNLGQEKSRTFQ